MNLHYRTGNGPTRKFTAEQEKKYQAQKKPEPKVVKPAKK